MEVLASELKKALDSLNSVISDKGLVDNCEKFVFDKDGIFAFNGEVFIAVKFDHDLSGAVGGDMFYKIINKHGADKIELVTKGDSLIVKKGKSESTFTFDVESECPISLNIKKWKDLPVNFLEAMNVCAFTTGKDYTDMRTVCIHAKGEYAESSDSFRITVFKMKGNLKKELFIPVDALSFFNKCKPVRYHQTENWCYYQDLNDTIICHRNISFSDDYPDLQGIIAESGDYKDLELPEKLYDSLEKASVFLNNKIEQDKFVRISCKSGKLKILSKCQGGQYSETLKVDFDDSVSFDVHPGYLMQAIERSSTISINDSTIKIISGDCTNLMALTVGEE